MQHIYNILFIAMAQDRIQIKEREKKQRTGSTSGSGTDSQAATPDEDNMDDQITVETREIDPECKMFLEMVVRGDALGGEPPNRFIKDGREYDGYLGWRIWLFTKNPTKQQNVIFTLYNYHKQSPKPTWKSAVKSLLMVNDVSMNR